MVSNRIHLKNLRLKNPKKIIFCYVNINFICNEFRNFCELVASNVGIIWIAEMKIESWFQCSQFFIPSFWKRGGTSTYEKFSLLSKVLPNFESFNEDCILI